MLHVTLCTCNNIENSVLVGGKRLGMKCHSGPEWGYKSQIKFLVSYAHCRVPKRRVTGIFWGLSKMCLQVLKKKKKKKLIVDDTFIISAVLTYCTCYTKK